MDNGLQVASPSEIRPNPENPRLIFRESELEELAASIEENGILVPLTVYRDSDGSLVLLDGERRWRCSKRLGLGRVPVIVQPRPSPMQNIMMMFAIHNARSDWDPLPTALKLEQLSKMHAEIEGHPPSEKELAQLASLSRGEVRRLRNILALPQPYLDRVMGEQDKPRSEQRLTVDHLLEITRAGRVLSERAVVDEPEREALEQALIEKFEDKVLTSTVDPRLLVRASRAVERGDVNAENLRRELGRLTRDPEYTIRDAYETSVEWSETRRSVALAAKRLSSDVLETFDHSQPLDPEIRATLLELRDVLDRLLGR